MTLDGALAHCRNPARGTLEGGAERVVSPRHPSAAKSLPP